METLNFNLVEICGRGYVVEHCVAAFQNKQMSKLYQVYVTDALKLIAENTANIAGGKSPQVRYIEAIENISSDEKEPEKTAEEVIDHIKDRLANL